LKKNLSADLELELVVVEMQASIRDSGERGHQSSLRFDFASIQEENLGCINFSLQYDPEQSLLTVRLIQVSYLTTSNRQNPTRIF